MPQKRRRQLFVNPSLQGRLLTQAVSYWFYCLLSIALFSACWIIVTERPASSLEMFGKLWSSCGPALLGSVALLPVVLTDCLRATNRFAGPMVRIQQAVHQLAEGRTAEPIEVRKGDHWEQLARDVNRMMQRGAAARSSDGDSSEPPE